MTEYATVRLTVWVQPKRDREARWVPCETIAPCLGTEMVKTPEDVSAVLSAQGRLVAMLLGAAGAAYTAFRIHARRESTGLLVGMTVWQMSPETGVLHLADGYPWADYSGKVDATQ